MAGDESGLTLERTRQEIGRLRKKIGGSRIRDAERLSDLRVREHELERELGLESI